MPKKLLRVAAYARVSTDKDDQVNSLTSQKKYFTEYITRHNGWALSKVYYDEGVSGTQTKKRAGFNQMIADALSGKFDLILTKEVSRFARNTVDTLSYTRKLMAEGVGVVFTIDNIDTRERDGEFRLTMMASIAQEESRKTSERVKWGQKRRMEDGVVFGRDMLGYTLKNGVLSINENEVPVVKAIFHKYTNEKKGASVIARELLEEGLRPKRISLWSNAVILRILRNEKYVGDLCQKKTYTPDYLTHKKKYNHGEEKMIYIQNHHEPIIDRELWKRTQEELKRRSSLAGKKTKHSNRYWCSGKIHCSECGHRYVSRTKKLTGGTYRAWRCYQTATHGSLKTDAAGNQIGCDNNSINDKALLTCMKYCISLVFQEQEVLQKEILSHVKEICGTNTENLDTVKITRQMERLEDKKCRAFDAMLEGTLTKDEFKKQCEWYDKELERLNSRLNDKRKENNTLHSQEGQMERLEKVLNEILDFDEENEVFYREILERIDIYKSPEKSCNLLVIWLKSLPFGIRLKVKSSGKGAGYRTDILEAELSM